MEELSKQARWPSRPELQRRAARARELLRCCTLCLRRCGVDRSGELAPAGGVCGLGATSHIYRSTLSMAEELELLPSMMVYFSGCSLRCRFCTQAPASLEPRGGKPVNPVELAAQLQAVLDRGARSINLVGGEPGLHLVTLLELAAAAARPLPLVLNSHMALDREVFELLAGVVSLYLADFKFGHDVCAQGLADAEGYFEAVTRGLLEVSGRARLIVRHLLLPGHHECCYVPVTRWLAGHLPGVRFSLQRGYVPAWQAWEDPGLARTLSGEEWEKARQHAGALGLRLEPGDPLESLS